MSVKNLPTGRGTDIRLVSLMVLAIKLFFTHRIKAAVGKRREEKK